MCADPFAQHKAVVFHSAQARYFLIFGQQVWRREKAHGQAEGCQWKEAHHWASGLGLEQCGQRYPEGHWSSLQ